MSQSGAEDPLRDELNGNALACYRPSVFVMDVENRLRGEPAFADVIEPFEDVFCDGMILHILANEVANVFARCGVDIFIAGSLVHIFSERIGQLNVQAAAHGNASLRDVGYRWSQAMYLAIDVNNCQATLIFMALPTGFEPVLQP